MVLDDQELSMAIERAASPSWSDRAAAGRQLATSDKIDKIADILHRLLLDEQDTAVTSETAIALLAREDTIGLRCVLLARSCAAEDGTADQIQAELDCDPEWMTAEGVRRLIRQLRVLLTDEDERVREEARLILAGMRPQVLRGLSDGSQE